MRLRPDSSARFSGKGRSAMTRETVGFGADFGSQACTRKKTLAAKTSTNGLTKSPRYRCRSRIQRVIDHILDGQEIASTDLSLSPLSRSVCRGAIITFAQTGKDALCQP